SPAGAVVPKRISDLEHETREEHLSRPREYRQSLLYATVFAAEYSPYERIHLCCIGTAFS
ncbi:MAG TPA: hypothetical protein VK581_01180, partial [Chthoniobacterales bacterium]|nr:hypothetical protein [Chthoniobacterales bacterium]